MSRTFNGSTHTVTMGPGAFSAVPFTYGTGVAIVRFTTVGDWFEILSQNTDLFFGINNSSQFTFATDGGSVGNSITAATNTWYCIIAAKATGSAAPKFNVYNYTTGAWTSATDSVSNANGSNNTTNWYIGSYQGSFERFPGDIAAVALYRQWVPTDAEAQGMGFHVNRGAWLAAQARADKSAVWFLDQNATTTTITDLTGGGANQTGGTVPAVSTLSVPLLGYGARILQPDTAAGGGDSTADLGTASVTVTANNLAVSTTLGTATITTAAVGPADALTTFAATAALTANLAGTGHTPLVALATTLANVLGYTDTVSVTAATLALSAANLAGTATPATATATATANTLTGVARTAIAAAVTTTAGSFADALTTIAATATLTASPLTASSPVNIALGTTTTTLAANALTGTGQTTQAATATLTASNPSGTRTPAAANASTLANPLAFTSATALQTATSVTVTAPPLARISVTELAATATFTANGASLGATIATANLATLALNLSYTAQPVLAAAAVTFAANGLALTPTSTLGTATSSLTANSLAVAVTQTAATATVTASPLADALTPATANATTLANPLTQTRTAAAASATATFTAFNLNNQVPGTATLGTAAVLVTAYQITPLALLSAVTPTAAFAAAQLTATDRAQPAATAPFTAAPLTGTDRQASTTVINITGHNLAGLYTPQTTLATVNLVAYNLANAAATAQVFRDWVQANVRGNQIAADVVHDMAAIEAFVHQ